MKISDILTPFTSQILEDQGHITTLFFAAIADFVTLIPRLAILAVRAYYLSKPPIHPLKIDLQFQGDRVNVHFQSYKLIKNHNFEHLSSINISQHVVFEGTQAHHIYIEEKSTTKGFARIPMVNQPESNDIPSHLRNPATREAIIERVKLNMPPTPEEATSFLEMKTPNDPSRGSNFRKLALKYHPDKLHDDPDYSDAGIRWLNWCMDKTK
jgi:hypothetical protein